MENKTEAGKKFIENLGIGRDTLIYILSTFEVNPHMQKMDIVYKGLNLEILREDWMSNIPNKRKFYDEIAGIKKQEVEVEVIEYEEEVSDLSLLKTVQTLRDKNIKLNKLIRENFREVTKRERILEEIKSAISDLRLDDFNPLCDGLVKSKTTNLHSVGILQLSDLHANEIIDEMGNKFDFEVLSKRLRKFVLKALCAFKEQNISKVYILGTGDFINSNRRPSEKVNSATSRVRASFIVVKLLTYIISEVLSFGMEVAVACVSSNESRIEMVNEMDDLSASENFDILIYHMLKLFLEDKGVEFIDCNMVEGVINVVEFGRNILITHGAQYGATDLQKKVQQTKGKFASRGIMIDHIFSGNIHSAYISDNFSRSGSACGGNGFSDSELNFDSRASQNYYIYHSNGAVDGTKIDLQDTMLVGYDIKNELEKYHVKKIIKGE